LTLTLSLPKGAYGHPLQRRGFWGKVNTPRGKEARAAEVLPEGKGPIGWQLKKEVKDKNCSLMSNCTSVRATRVALGVLCEWYGAYLLTNFCFFLLFLIFKFDT
jgi:hypothetical protein